jgi:hypothetical protein
MLKEPAPGEGVAAARGPALLDLCLRHPRQPGQDRGLFRFLFRGPPSGFGFPADGDRAGDEAGFADGVAADGPGVTARRMRRCSRRSASARRVAICRVLPAWPAVCRGSPGSLGDEQLNGLFSAYLRTSPLDPSYVGVSAVNGW